MAKERGQNGFAYRSVFDSMDWLISQRLPSGSAKCAVRNPQRWSVGDLTNVTPFALSSSYAASTSATPAARSPRGPPSIFSSLTSVPSRPAAPEGESKIKYNPSSRRKHAESPSHPSSLSFNLPLYNTLHPHRP